MMHFTILKLESHVMSRDLPVSIPSRPLTAVVPLPHLLGSAAQTLYPHRLCHYAHHAYLEVTSVMKIDHKLC